MDNGLHINDGLLWCKLFECHNLVATYALVTKGQMGALGQQLCPRCSVTKATSYNYSFWFVSNIVTSFLVLRAIGGCLRLCSRWSLYHFIFLNAHGMFWFVILCLSSYLHVMIAYEQEVNHVSPLEFVQGGCLKRVFMMTTRHQSSMRVLKSRGVGLPTMILNDLCGWPRNKSPSVLEDWKWTQMYTQQWVANK